MIQVAFVADGAQVATGGADATQVVPQRRSANEPGAHVGGRLEELILEDPGDTGALGKGVDLAPRQHHRRSAERLLETMDDGSADLAGDRICVGARLQRDDDTHRGYVAGDLYAVLERSQAIGCRRLLGPRGAHRER